MCAVTEQIYLFSASYDVISTAEVRLNISLIIRQILYGQQFAFSNVFYTSAPFLLTWINSNPSMDK